MQLLGYLYEDYHDARSLEHKKIALVLLTFSFMYFAIIIMDCFAWNIRGACCNVSLMLQLVQPQVALTHY